MIKNYDLETQCKTSRVCIKTDPNKPIDEYYFDPRRLGGKNHRVTDPRFLEKEQTMYLESGKELEEDPRSGVVIVAGLEYEYSDRLNQQYDQRQRTKARTKADNSGAKKDSARWFQEYLSALMGKPIHLQYIICGINRMDGYPYLVYGFKPQEQNRQ